MLYNDRLTKVCWFGFGLWVIFPQHVLLWIATEDILSGSLQSTTIVLVAFTVPDILSKAVVSPRIVDRISFLPAFILHSILFLVVQLTFVFINVVKVRLAGMCVLGFANGLGTIAAVKLLGFYGESTGVYQSGHNLALAVASISYTGLTTWVCVSPRIAIVILSPLCLFPLLMYALLDKEPLKSYKNSTKDIAYQSLDDKVDGVQSATLCANKATKTESILQKVKLLFNGFLVCYYRGLGNFLIQLSITAILSTVTFKSSPFPPRDHYQYFRFLSDFGIMLGGMELSLVSLFCPRFLDSIKIRRIWILILLDVSHVMVFLSVSWFRFIDNVYIIFVLCFTQGVTSGCISVHIFSLAADFFSDSRKLGKVLGYMEVSLSVGRLSAGLLGLFLEKYLRDHCEHQLLLGRFCLARHSSTGMWMTSNCGR